MLFCDSDSTAFANDHNLDLARVLHLAFNAMSDVMGQDDGLRLVDDFRFDHDTDFATCLDSVGALYALVRVCNLFEFLKALNVGVERFLASTGTRGGDSVCSLDEYVKHAIRLNVVVVRFDCVDDFGTLAEAAGEICTDDCVAAFDLVIDCLTEVMQQSCSFCGNRVEPKL